MPLHSVHIRRFIVAVVVACVLTPAISLAEPSTPEIEAAKEQARSAQLELMDLAAQLELRTEEYYAITAELQETRDAIAETRIELERADAELQRSTDLLEERAAGMYRGGVVDMLEVLLGTSSFQDFITRMDWLQRIGQNDAALVEAVKVARELVRQTEESLERREQEQALLRAQADVKKSQMEQAVSQQSSYVDSLNSDVARLVAEEEERLRVLAEERARQAAEEAARAAEAASSGVGSTLGSGATGVGHPEVLDIALQYLGVPYVWGGSTPAGFDCSGLAQYCYAQIGVTIPRNSRSQFAAGSRIPEDRLDLLAVGDLVFFGYGGDPGRVHHVGIYAGNGNFVHAPYTGASVRVDSLVERISSSNDYVGASRY